MINQPTHENEAAGYGKIGADLSMWVSVIYGPPTIIIRDVNVHVLQGGALGSVVGS